MLVHFKQQPWTWLLVLMFGLIQSVVFADVAANKLLSADSAFKLSVQLKSAAQINAKFQIEPGYYLYRNHIFFSFIPNVMASVHYPNGVLKTMPDDSRIEVYDGTIDVPIYLQNVQSALQLNVSYQGCSKRGLCFPPITKTFKVDFNAQTITSPDASTFDSPPGITKLITNHRGVSSLLESQNLFLSLLMFIAFGLILAFTPCVLPMIPILTSIIVGQQGSVTAKKAFFLSLSYILGASLMYAGAGVLAAAMGSLLQAALQTPLVITMTSVFFVLLSLSMFGFYDLQMPNVFHHHILFLSNKQSSGKYLGVFLMGILSTLIVSPCVTAPLMGTLLYISHTHNLLYGGSALFMLGLGMGIPLLVIGTSAGRWLPRTGPWMEAVRKTCGFAMLAMAVWLASRIISPVMMYLFWGLLLFALALFLAFSLPRIVGQHVLGKSLGIIAAVLGLVLLFTTAIIPNPWFSNTDLMKKQAFIRVYDLQEMDKQLAIARKSKQPVLLDFYADWCESCVAMDRNIFKSSTIQSLLENYKLLRVDLSQNTATDEKLMQKFAIVAPPTIVFFGPDGREVNSKRIVGEVNAGEFLARLGADNGK